MQRQRHAASPPATTPSAAARTMPLAKSTAWPTLSGCCLGGDRSGARPVSFTVTRACHPRARCRRRERRSAPTDSLPPRPTSRATISGRAVPAGPALHPRYLATPSRSLRRSVRPAHPNAGPFHQLGRHPGRREADRWVAEALRRCRGSLRTLRPFQRPVRRRFHSAWLARLRCWGRGGAHRVQSPASGRNPVASPGGGQGRHSPARSSIVLMGADTNPPPTCCPMRAWRLCNGLANKSLCAQIWGATAACPR